MNRGPQNSTIWALEGSRMLTALRRLWGQRSGRPRGVLDQSKARISAPSSPPPSRKVVVGAARAVSAGALGVMERGYGRRRKGAKAERARLKNDPQEYSEGDQRQRQQGKPHREHEA